MKAYQTLHQVYSDLKVSDRSFRDQDGMLSGVWLLNAAGIFKTEICYA
jgi:hypothetical protein